MRRAAIGSGLALLLLAGAVTGVGTSGAAPSSDAGCEPTVATAIPQPTAAQLEAAGLGDIALAPVAARRDLTTAPFTDPTTIDNPWFPISDLRSAILNGHVDGEVFHTETTLLAATRIIEWTPGQCVRVLVSQYMAFLDGRLQETAIDLYAQDDAGSVWYLGEDVFDYAPSGVITTTEGTWHAGTDGPLAMIMPADPAVGDANRPENIPGNVFEEVVITATGITVEGPLGPVGGAIVGTETHQDAALSDKVFAPGYGEFRSTDGGDVEALALAVPTDAVPGGVPRSLATMVRGAEALFDAPLRSDADRAAATLIVDHMARAWAAFRAGEVPRRLVRPMSAALRAVTDAVRLGPASDIRWASVDAAYAANDLTLRYRRITRVDARRFELWARRALLDARAGLLDGVRSDQVTLEWIRDRIAPSLDPVALTTLDTLVRDLGAAVVDRDRVGATDLARLLTSLAEGLAT